MGNMWALCRGRNYRNLKKEALMSDPVTAKNTHDDVSDDKKISEAS